MNKPQVHAVRSTAAQCADDRAGMFSFSPIDIYTQRTSSVAWLGGCGHFSFRRPLSPTRIAWEGRLLLICTRCFFFPNVLVSTCIWRWRDVIAAARVSKSGCVLCRCVCCICAFHLRPSTNSIMHRLVQSIGLLLCMLMTSHLLEPGMHRACFVSSSDPTRMAHVTQGWPPTFGRCRLFGNVRLLHDRQLSAYNMQCRPGDSTIMVRPEIHFVTNSCIALWRWRCLHWDDRMRNTWWVGFWGVGSAFVVHVWFLFCFSLLPFSCYLSIHLPIFHSLIHSLVLSFPMFLSNNAVLEGARPSDIHRLKRMLESHLSP